jgi:predicted nucleic acid-binding protein
MVNINTKFVVDASFVACYLMPDEHEAQVDQIFLRFFQGDVQLLTPHILTYEIGNIISTSIKRKRIVSTLGKQLLNLYSQIPITIENTELEITLNFTAQHNITFYDASYLQLAITNKCPLLTLDKRLNEISQKISSTPISL